MSKLIILRGNSGSGKSTVAKALQQKFGPNTLLISQDAVRRELLMVRDGAENPALPLLLELLRYGRQHCAVTILEGILNAVWYRPLFEAAQAEFSTEIFAYYYDLPFEETLLRHQTKPNRNDFGEQELRSWWNEHDLIGFLPERLLTPSQSVEEVVQLIWTAVNQ